MSEQGRKGQSHSNARWSQQNRFSGGSDSNDDDSDSPPAIRRKPSGSQVPLKKRHQPDKHKDRQRNDADDEHFSGDDSDSAPSVGSDLYKDEFDKQQLEKMSELEREMILADRGARLDDYRLKKSARASSKLEKSRKESPPPPPTRGRQSARTDRSVQRNNALDEIRAKRMRQQDPEGYGKRFTASIPGILGSRDASSPTRGRSPSPSMEKYDGDRSKSKLFRRGLGDHRHKDDEFEDISPRLDPLKFDDIKNITVRRSKLVKWFMEPFFEKLIAGCFVRIGIGRTKSGPKYRLCLVKNVDATDPDRNYKLDAYVTCKWLNVVWDNEAASARWPMTQASDSPPLEEEFKEWLQEAEKNGVRLPTRQEVLEKKDDIQKLHSYVYSADTVKQMLQEKSAARRPVNVAAEKERLRRSLEVAKSRRDNASVESIQARLEELENMSRKQNQVNDRAAKLEEMNRRNRFENFKNASQAKPANLDLKAGEAGYDPFSRRWTRSRNYYLSKPVEDTTNAAAAEAAAADGNINGTAAAVEDKAAELKEEDPAAWEKGGASAVGVVATAAALEAAADAGKLVDTRAPVDHGTALNSRHDFDLQISLATLVEYGGPDGYLKAYTKRRQLAEQRFGCKVPENDGWRHALTLTVSDYKRRRDML